MKKTTRWVVFLTIILTFNMFVLSARGGQTFPFGNKQKVEKYAASKVNRIFFFVWAYDVSGEFDQEFGGGTWYASKPFTNKLEMDMVITNNLTTIMSLLIQSTNTNLDKGRGIVAYIEGDMAENRELSQAIFSSGDYVFIKPEVVDGKLTPPDLSWFSTEINTDIPFYVPNLKWARMEVGLVGDSVPYEVYDRLLDPTSNPIASDGFMYLPVETLVNSATGGKYWLKLSILTGDSFQSYDGNGNPLPVTQTKLSIARNSNSMTIVVSGGDSGQGFYLQQSSNLKDWVNYGPITFVSPLSHIGGKSSFYVPNTNGTDFFRTVSTNAVPH